MTHDVFVPPQIRRNFTHRIKIHPAIFEAFVLSTSRFSVFEGVDSPTYSSSCSQIASSRMKLNAFEEGETVLCCYKNTWYPARIVKVNALDGTRFKVHNLGYKKKWDEWITKNMIKKYTGRNFKNCKVVGEFKEMYVKSSKIMGTRSTSQKQETPASSQGDDTKFKNDSPTIDKTFEDGITQDQEETKNEMSSE